MKKYKNVLIGFLAAAIVAGSAYNTRLSIVLTELSKNKFMNSSFSLFANAESTTPSCPGFKLSLYIEEIPTGRGTIYYGNGGSNEKVKSINYRVPVHNYNFIL